MGRFKHVSFAAAGLIGLGVLATPAFAGTIFVDSSALPYSETVNISGNVANRGSVTDNNQLAGQIVLTVNDGTTANPSAEYTLLTWCVDLFHTITLGQPAGAYSTGSLLTDNSGTNPGTGTPLNSTQISLIGDLVAYGNHLLQTDTVGARNLDSALVQAAIWTVEYNSVAFGGSNTLAVIGTGINPTSIANEIASAQAYGGSADQITSLDGAQGLAYQAPAPVIGSSLSGVLALGGLLLGARLLERGKKRSSLGTAAA